MGLFVWDEMVHRNKTKEPFKITPIVQSNYKGLYKFLQRELKRPPITEAYSEHLVSVNYPESSFVDLTIVRCYPNDLHVCDIELSNFLKPVSLADPTVRFRKFHGLNMLDEVLDNIASIGRTKGCERISLMVAHPPLHDVFSRHGFMVSETEMAQTAFTQKGTGHPMVKFI